MGVDEGMNCRHAAVAVRWRKEDGGSGSSPAFSGVRGRQRQQRKRGGLNERSNSQSGNIAL